MTAVAFLATAQSNRLSIADFTIAPGETKTVTVNLDNETNFAGIQWHMVLPEGLNIGTKSNGNPAVTIDPNRTDGHVVTSGFKDGGVQVTIYSPDALPFVGNSGSFLTFNVTASADFSGSHLIVVSKVVAATELAKKYVLSDFNVNVVASAPVASGITLNKSSLNLAVGASETLKATITPSSASQTVAWSSSNPSVATVNSSGKVTAVAAGSAIITATTGDGTNLTAQCAVMVELPKASSISLNKNSMSLGVGASETLVATVLPATASQAVTWSSTNSAIASVDASGKVTAVAAGNAIITATTADGSNLSAQCAVAVNVPKATSIKLNKNAISLDVYESETLVATVLPAAAAQSVTWKSSNTAVATVNDGKVVAVAAGTATITATTADGSALSATCAVAVNAPKAMAITLNMSELTMSVGGNETLIATVLPAIASQDVAWTSTNNSIVRVSDSGVVTAVGSGNAIITATTTDGSALSATCAVNVKEVGKVESLVTTSYDIPLGLTIRFNVAALPESAKNKTLSWKSNNSGVAAVDAGGNIITRTVGTATITATTTDGSNISQEFVLNVTPVQPYYDLNQDGSVNVGDVSSLYEYILNGGN